MARFFASLFPVRAKSLSTFLACSGAQRFFSVGSTTFVHPKAVLIGNVTLGKNVSIWPGAVLRGDVNSISVGDCSNIQDNCVVHCTGNWTGPGSGHPTVIGARVSIGHLAMLHGSTIHDDVLIGMNATVMDGAVIPSHTILGAGSLVPPGKVLAPGGLYVGRPAQRVRDLRPEELQWIQNNFSRYVTLKEQYLEDLEHTRLLSNTEDLEQTP